MVIIEDKNILKKELTFPVNIYRTVFAYSSVEILIHLNLLYTNIQFLNLINFQEIVIGRSAGEDKQIPTVIEITAQIIASNLALAIRQLRNSKIELSVA